MLERCWASNWRARNQRDDRRNIPSTQASLCGRTEAWILLHWPSPPPLDSMPVLWIHCGWKNAWSTTMMWTCSTTWWGMRTTTNRNNTWREAATAIHICLKLSPPHVHGAASGPHTSARTGQALHSAGHKATNIFCSLKPTLISYLYIAAHVFWGILPKNEYVHVKIYEALLVGRVGGKTPKYIG